MTLSRLAILTALCFGAATTAAAQSSVVKIVKRGDGYQLIRNGQPYFVKGGSGASRDHFDDLKAAGGNSVRSFSGTDIFDQAQKYGFSVLAGIHIGLPRHGFNYGDPAQVQKQKETVLETVHRYKSHPAILMWALGNEVELGISESERIRVWQNINELARAVKAIDKDHPVIAVLAGIGPNKLAEVDKYCPDLDAVGINAYGGMTHVPEEIDRQGFKRPYLITEFGPRGHWEVDKTAWGLPIEDTSTEKAEFYEKAYEHTIASRPACLGAYVFLWGQKQEKTHTWYGMFMPNGNRLGPVDAMQHAWTGKWPENRCPLIKGQIQTAGSTSNVYTPGSKVKFSIEATDPDNDPVTVTWDLRKDVSDNPSTGGDREPDTQPIAGAVVSSNGQSVEIRMPSEPGNYRLFTYAHDPQQHAATANLPVQVAEAGQISRRVTFEGTTGEHSWTIKELNPDWPSDWSNYRYLVVEFKASSPQRFEFRLNTPKGFSRVMMHPYQGAWVRAALSLDWFSKVPSEGTDMASVGNRSHPGYFVSFWGPYRPLNAIDSIGVVMEYPIGRPTLDIRSVRLAKDTPGDAVLAKEPLVDQFGQWANDEWPGKAHSLDDLKKAWAAEDRSLTSGDFDFCKYGGYKNTKAKATGFFRVEQIDGKWWFVDPDGHLFLSTGSDVIIPWMSTPVENREHVFSALPPENLGPPRRRADSEPGASFAAWNLERRFGADWQAKWADYTFRRMDAWGLNTVANWSDPILWEAHKKPYAIPLHGWNTKTNYMGMPDVFSDEFVQNVDKAAAAQCDPRRNDPYLLGYFVGNEPPWQGRESVLVDMILAGPDNAIKREAQKALADGDTEEARKQFIYRAVIRYLTVVNQAVKKHDPNHLNLGIRFAGAPPDEMISAAKQFDVYSINIYDYEPRPEMLAKTYQMIGRPMLIGEFHFGTPGRGMAASLKQVRDHAERGTAYRYYVENAFAMPALIGTHWFEWMDEPVTGRGDGENYNIGFVDGTDRPYPEFVEAAKATHKRLQAVHSGSEPPFSQKAAIQ